MQCTFVTKICFRFNTKHVLCTLCAQSFFRQTHAKSVQTNYKPIFGIWCARSGVNVGHTELKKPFFVVALQEIMHIDILNWNNAIFHEHFVFLFCVVVVSFLFSWTLTCIWVSRWISKENNDSLRNNWCFSLCTDYFVGCYSHFCNFEQWG